MYTILIATCTCTCNTQCERHSLYTTKGFHIHVPCAVSGVVGSGQEGVEAVLGQLHVER